ncbi:MAG: helix-turn-helix domain-containing protein [Planctomycetota bacterium]|jgi:AraC-like DNA-binding protein
MSKTDTNDDFFSTLFNALSAGGRLTVNHIFSLTVPLEWKIEPRIIEDIHLLFVRGGRGDYWVDGRHIPMEAGRVVLVGPGVEYVAEQDQNDPPVIIPVRFDLVARRRPVLPPFAMDLLTTPDDPYEPLFTLSRDFHLAGDDAAAGSALHCILKRLEQSHSRVNSQRDRRIEKIHHRICQAPERRHPLAKLAQACGLSPKHLTRLFIAQYGISPKQLQIRLRINRARGLLEDTPLHLKEIAARLGYPDAYTFAKQFKAQTGIPPGRLRRTQSH